MQVIAKAKYLKTSAQKLRLSADMVRGVRVNDALDQLRVHNRKSAQFVYETLKSAVANAENNHNMNKNNLVVSEIRVDQGPNLKRFRPRSRGMANQVLHPMAHLTIGVSEAKKPEPKQAPAAKKPAAKEETK